MNNEHKESIELQPMGTDSTTLALMSAQDDEIDNAVRKERARITSFSLVYSLCNTVGLGTLFLLLEFFLRPHGLPMYLQIIAVGIAAPKLLVILLYLWMWPGRKSDLGQVPRGFFATVKLSGRGAWRMALPWLFGLDVVVTVGLTATAFLDHVWMRCMFVQQ